MDSRKSTVILHVKGNRNVLVNVFTICHNSVTLTLAKYCSFFTTFPSREYGILYRTLMCTIHSRFAFNLRLSNV